MTQKCPHCAMLQNVIVEMVAKKLNPVVWYTDEATKLAEITDC